jgi:glycosyltransferase involved in cell wall biosynthesis
VTAGPASRRVTVVVPTCDRPTLLREALASIRRLEGPDLACEIVVGDNGSMPETRLVAQEFDAIYRTVDRRGAGAARNTAMKDPTGDYIAFLDDDDIWLPGHLRGQIALLEARPELAAAVGQVVSTDPDRRPTSPPWPQDLPRDGDLFATMLRGYFPQIGATVVRARVVQSVGGFDESLLGDQDWDWQLRIAATHKVGFVETACVHFRQRPSGTFDDLQLRRYPFTRRVFLRHALARRRVWRSPLHLLRSYSAALQIYYNYFEDAAVVRAERGERRAALRAIWSALRIVPTTSLRQLWRPTPFRKALVQCLAPGRRRNGAVSRDEPSQPSSGSRRD